MAFSGRFKEGFATKFGHSVTVENQKGDWRLYGQGMRPPEFAAGDEVEFEATSKEGKDGKKYWHYTNMRPKGTSAPTPSQAKTYGAKSDDQSRLMFITGIVGRAMGSGKFDAVDIESLTLAAEQAYGLLGSKRAPEEDVPY